MTLDQETPNSALQTLAQEVLDQTMTERGAYNILVNHHGEPPNGYSWHPVLTDALRAEAATRGWTEGQFQTALGLQYVPTPLPDPWSFSDLVEYARRAIDTLKYGYAPTWTGPELTWTNILAGSPTISEQLHPDGLANATERGRDRLDVLLSVILQVGIEQGARSYERELRTHDTHYVRLAREIVEAYYHDQPVTTPRRDEEAKTKIRELFKKAVEKRATQKGAFDKIREVLSEFEKEHDREPNGYMDQIEEILDEVERPSK